MLVSMLYAIIDVLSVTSVYDTCGVGLLAGILMEQVNFVYAISILDIK
jgi:hypothetical protein